MDPGLHNKKVNPFSFGKINESSFESWEAYDKKKTDIELTQLKLDQSTELKKGEITTNLEIIIN